jgi:ferredoxin
MRRAPDVLTWPLLGRFLKWQHARTAMQTPVLLLTALILFDGLLGPQLAPKNLATVSVWLHYRGLVVLALLVAGNLFCMACPFMLPRQAARWLRERFCGGGRPFPAIVRNKWLALALVLAFFFVYERFSLWASPWLTAWIILAYFAIAFAVDTLFRGAAFCKYVCPLGQFNFFGSLISPLEIKVREPGTCATCRTKDCIQYQPAKPLWPVSGRARPRSETGPQQSSDRETQGVRGCELWLFQPRKVGNMDCTFCLDCIHACPYDNVGIIGRVPTSELWRDPFRSGIGRFSQRRDLAALVALFVFGSFINAFAMIRPVYALRDQIGRWLGGASPTSELAVIFLIGLIVLPALLLSASGLITRMLARSDDPIRSLISRYIYALVPLGFGMWLAHYSFHFLTGGLTLVPVAQSFLADVGLLGGAVQWGLGPMVPGEWLFPIEAIFLYAGAFASIVAALQIALNHLGMTHNDDPAAALKLAAPWVVLILILLLAGLAILVQPMEMRGTLQMSGSRP